jgi:hypothetical protein
MSEIVDFLHQNPLLMTHLEPHNFRSPLYSTRDQRHHHVCLTRSPSHLPCSLTYLLNLDRPSVVALPPSCLALSILGAESPSSQAGRLIPAAIPVSSFTCYASLSTEFQQEKSSAEARKQSTFILAWLRFVSVESAPPFYQESICDRGA